MEIRWTSRLQINYFILLAKSHVTGGGIALGIALIFPKAGSAVIVYTLSGERGARSGVLETEALGAQAIAVRQTLPKKCLALAFPDRCYLWAIGYSVLLQ